jgi:carbonic anhydrase
VKLDKLHLEAPSGDAKRALNKLVAGNARFAAGKASRPNQSMSRVEAVAGKQSPYAVVLTCADSRVSPELLFDTGLGDLFVLRVAGNVVDDPMLGSVEYALEYLGAPLVVVLGHENCGAVKVAVESAGTGRLPNNNVKSIIKLMLPVIEAVEADHEGAELSEEELVDEVVSANARYSAYQIHDRSILRADTTGHGVVAARYDLDTAKVTLLR